MGYVMGYDYRLWVMIHSYRELYISTCWPHFKTLIYTYTLACRLKNKPFGLHIAFNLDTTRFQLMNSCVGEEPGNLDRYIHNHCSGRSLICRYHIFTALYIYPNWKFRYNKKCFRQSWFNNRNFLWNLMNTVKSQLTQLTDISFCC